MMLYNSSLRCHWVLIKLSWCQQK